MGPELLKIVLQPLLGLRPSVPRGTILSEDVLGVGVGCLDPQLYHSP